MPRSSFWKMKSPLFIEERASSIRFRDLERTYVLCLGTLLALSSLEFDSLSVFEIPKSIPDNAREMDEEVFAPFIRSNEAIALLLAEPLNRALSQSTFSLPLSESLVGDPCLRRSYIAADMPSTSHHFKIL